ncbi:hypothetical protein BIW11_09289, partial [Tropilaelaps mercedesae]
IGRVSNHLEAGAYTPLGSQPGSNQVPGALAMGGMGPGGLAIPPTGAPLTNMSPQPPHLGVPASHQDPRMPTQLPPALQSPGTPLSPPRRQSLYGATPSSIHLQQQPGQQQHQRPQGSQVGSSQQQQQILSSTIPQQLQHPLNQIQLGLQQEDRLGANQVLPSTSAPHSSQTPNLHQRAQQPYLTDNTSIQQSQLQQANQGGASDRRGRSQGRGARSGPEPGSGGALNDHFDHYRRSESRPSSGPPSRSRSRMSQSPSRQSSTVKEAQESLSAIYGIKGADEATADSLTQRLGERLQQQPSTSEETSALGRTASLYIGKGSHYH